MWWGCAFGIGVGARAVFRRRFDSWNIKKEIGRVGDSRTTIKELAEGRRKSEAQNARAQAQRTGEDLEGRLRAHKTATIWLEGNQDVWFWREGGRETRTRTKRREGEGVRRGGGLMRAEQAHGQRRENDGAGETNGVSVCCRPASVCSG
jgi:hypothetical protein